MSKYIDAEKLKAELKRQKHELELSIQSQGDYGRSCHIVAYENILSLITSLQQEQPSLPSSLDEAAEEYAYNNWEDNDYHTGASEGLPFDAIGHTEKCFKAGAEWMAGQGVSVDALAGYCMGDVLCPDFELEEMSAKLKHAGFQPGDKVVVQIRKK